MADETYLKNLELEFEQQTWEDLISLLSQAKEVEGNEKLTAVVRTVRVNGVITFKQWKYIKANLKQKTYNPFKRI